VTFDEIISFIQNYFVSLHLKTISPQNDMNYEKVGITLHGIVSYFGLSGMFHR
jgi:hypothetical protein